MPVDDALALADHVLAAYSASGPQDTPGPDLLWADQLARALRELATAVSVRHVTPVSGRPTAVITRARQARDDATRRSGRRAGHAGLGGMLRAWASRTAGHAPEPEAVVLSLAQAETVRQALADAGAWHGARGLRGVRCGRRVRRPGAAWADRRGVHGVAGPSGR
jgi:hypothetical protein